MVENQGQTELAAQLPLPSGKPENFAPRRIAFLFAGGRECREGGPSDFFYGARELARWGDEIELVDLDQEQSAGRLARAYDFALGHFTPARTRGIDFERTWRILDRLHGHDCVVATYAGAALALAFWRRTGFLRRPMVAIQCGLANYRLPTPRRLSTRFLLSGYPSILFAASEMASMRGRFRLGERELINGVYGIDSDFWCPGEPRERNGILSVGNDARRDYSMLAEAAREVPHEFRVLTRRRLPPETPDNVKLIASNWHESTVSDDELRDLYRSAACVAIPLESSLQPSGQSVALQAIACGTPVVMTNTIGNWCPGLLDEGEGIHFSIPRDHRSLAEKINQVLRDENAPVAALRARRKLIDNGVTIEGFARRLRDQITLVTAGPAND